MEDGHTFAPMIARMTIPAAFALLLLATGCGKSKVDQCNAFVEKANAGQTVLNGLDLATEDGKKLEDAASKVDAEAKAVGGVELKDAKLIELRDKYAANLTKLAGNVRSLAKLYVGKASPEEAKKVEADAEKIEKDESKLVDEVNTYCSAH